MPSIPELTKRQISLIIGKEAYAELKSDLSLALNTENLERFIALRRLSAAFEKAMAQPRIVRSCVSPDTGKGIIDMLVRDIVIRNKKDAALYREILNTADTVVMGAHGAYEMEVSFRVHDVIIRK